MKVMIDSNVMEQFSKNKNKYNNNKNFCKITSAKYRGQICLLSSVMKKYTYKMISNLNKTKWISIYDRE